MADCLQTNPVNVPKTSAWQSYVDRPRQVTARYQDMPAATNLHESSISAQQIHYINPTFDRSILGCVTCNCAAI